MAHQSEGHADQRVAFRLQLGARDLPGVCRTIPTYYITGLPYTNPVNTFRTQGRNTDTYNKADNANWVHGEHTVSLRLPGPVVPHRKVQRCRHHSHLHLGLGINASLAFVAVARNQLHRSGPRQQPAGSQGGYTAATPRLSTYQPDQGFVKGLTISRHDIYDNYAAYVQDSWKTSRRLTLNLGVRWDYYTPVDERDAPGSVPRAAEQQSDRDGLNPNTVLDFAGGKRGRPWYTADKNNFAPNMGLA